MNWKESYGKKLCTADEAVIAGIHSNDRVVFGMAACEPEILIKAMVNNKDHYENITVSQMVSASPMMTTLPENSDTFPVRRLVYRQLCYQGYYGGTR